MIEFLSNLQRLHSVDRAIDDSQFNEAWAAFSLDLATGRIQALAVSAEVITVSSDRGLNQLVAALGMRFLDPAQEEPPAPTA